MADLATALEELTNASTIDAVETIANSLSAAATEPGGAVLYSGYVGSASAHDIALSIAKTDGLNIIDNTVRAQFLENPLVQDTLSSIYTALNPSATPAEIQNLVTQELYGGNSSSLWGQASADFASSIEGPVTVIASNVNPERVFANVEIPAILANSGITAINNVPVLELPQTGSALISFVESSFSAALAAGGTFAAAAAESTGQLVSSEVLSKLGVATNGAETAAQYAAQGLVQSSAPALETTAAVDAGSILASAGSKALGLLASPLGGAIINLLFSSTPLNSGEDQILEQLNAAPLDTPGADLNQNVTTDTNGVTAISVPLVSPDGTTNDQYDLSVNPTTDSAILAVATNDDSTLDISSDINGVLVSDDQIADSLPNQAYDDQISIGADANGTLDVTVTIEQGDTSTVDSDIPVVGVSQDFAFSGTGDTLLIDAPITFTGTISAFLPGDTIDLAGVSATSGTLDGTGDLTIQESGGGTLNYAVTDSAGPQNVYAVPDGNGGTDLVLTEPVPVTTAPGSQAVTYGAATPISGLSVAVPGGPSTNEVLTVVLSDQEGLLGATQVVGGTVIGAGSQTLTLSGNLSAINSELSTVTYTGAGDSVSDAISVVTSNDQGNGDSHIVNVTNETDGSPDTIFSYVGDDFAYGNPGNITATFVYANASTNGSNELLSADSIGNMFDWAPALSNSNYNGSLLEAWSVGAYGVTFTGSDSGDFGSEPGDGLDGVNIYTLNDTVTSWSFSVEIAQVSPSGSTELTFNAESIYQPENAFNSTPSDSASYGTLDEGFGGGNNTTPGLWTVSSALCFLAGTQIATPKGEVPVERLAVGDAVLTLNGKERPIAWIGVGRVLATRGQRSAATPVIVRKGAIAGNVPHRDLHITKGHSLFVDGVLIPVEFLVNHRTILWDDRAQEVAIYHIELESHDVLIANGAPAESYRDDGNRWLFQNANSGWGLPPQESCAPVLTGGSLVDVIWRRLLNRAGPRPRLPLTDEPDLHLLVDGRRIDPVSRGDTWHLFRVAARPMTARIRSRSAAPQELGLARDPRCLGVAVRSIVVRQEARFRNFEASDALLNEGFHMFEADNGFRWTDGDALLPSEMFVGFAGPIELVLHIGATAQYTEEGVAIRAA